MLMIGRSRERLIFNMGIPICGKDGLYIETGPRSFHVSCGFSGLLMGEHTMCDETVRTVNLDERTVTEIRVLGGQVVSS